MRVIAGTFKGRRLEGPPDAGVRPTSDGLRETLFNVIRDRVPGARVLDAFAGTGAVGLEAMSRGASHATFVEREPTVVRILERNIASCGVQDACRVVREPFARWADRAKTVGAAGEAEAFDVVFIDPPYDLEALVPAIEAAAALARPGGMLIVEHSSRRTPPESASGLRRTRVLRAGDSALAFYTSE